MRRKKVTEEELCASCGVQIPSGAIYCPHCGAEIDSTSVTREDAPYEDLLIDEEKENSESDEITDYKAYMLKQRSESRLPVGTLSTGTIRGTVTEESRNNLVKSSSGFRRVGVFFAGVYFSMKVENTIGGEGITDERPIFTSRFGYFGIGDKVILQGGHFYNETLQIGDVGFQFLPEIDKLYEGIIQGTVTREAKIRVNGTGNFSNLYFVMKLDESIGVEGIPEEILIKTGKPGYFRIGDKVILKGKIFKEIHEQFGKPMYIIVSDNWYNESLQIGD